MFAAPAARVKSIDRRLDLRSHDEFMASQTGVPVSSVDTWRERQSRYCAQDELSRRVAAILEPAGVDPFREGEAVAFLGLLTGAVELVEHQYRNIYFLPTVAATHRAPMADTLELYLSTYAPGARYGVITSGVRCQVGELRARIVRLSRRVSIWHRNICAPLGIEVLIRSIELPCDDGLTFHVHANVLSVLDHRLPPHVWADFLRQTRAFFAAHWQDNGRLEDVREVVKYVMKGDDLVRLADRAPHLIPELYHQLERLHLVQPLGGFRDFRRWLEDDRRQAVPEYVKGRRHLVALKRPKCTRREQPAAGGPQTNQILAVTRPTARFCNEREPLLLIANLDPETLWDDPAKRELARQALANSQRTYAAPA